MAEGPTGSSTTWKFNAACLRASASFGIGWLFWLGGQTPGAELFLYFAIIFGVVGVKHAIIALVQLVRLILRARAWARFKRKGAPPKADRLAGAEDLKRGGLIK